MIRFVLCAAALALLSLLPARAVAAAKTDEQLVQQATTEAVDELKLHLIKEYKRVSDITAKVRKAERVPGWRQIRVSGDAAFATWDRRERDYIWRSGKFAVEFDLTNDNELKASTVMFDGISRPIEP